jgi:hypothetical protein
VGPRSRRGPEPPVSGPLLRSFAPMVQEIHVPSNYKQEPDHGGPEPSLESMALVAAILAGLGVSLLCVVVEWWS